MTTRLAVCPRVQRRTKNGFEEHWIDCSCRNLPDGRRGICAVCQHRIGIWQRCGRRNGNHASCDCALWRGRDGTIGGHAVGQRCCEHQYRGGQVVQEEKQDCQGECRCGDSGRDRQRAGDTTRGDATGCAKNAVSRSKTKNRCGDSISSRACLGPRKLGMRKLWLAALLGVSVAASAQTQPQTSSGSTAGTTSSGSTSGQSIAGQSTTGQSLTRTTQPAPAVTTPPINPQPGTSPTLLSGTPAKAASRKRGRTGMGTSNTYQNGVNGSVNSDAVANGSAPTTVPSATGSSSTVQPMATPTNGPSSAPGTVAQPTPAAPVATH